MVRGLGNLDTDSMSFNALIEVAEAYLWMTVIDRKYEESAKEYLAAAHRTLHFNRKELRGDSQKAIAYGRVAKGWAFLAALAQGFSMIGAVKQMGLSLELGGKEGSGDGHVDMYQEGDWS